MKPMQLTGAALGAHSAPMTGRGAHNRGRAMPGLIAVAIAGPVLLGGCINVNAPAEPIVIELNINIRQEVIYRLAEDAGNTIEENADIF